MAAGLSYGAGENIFHFLFKVSYRVPEFVYSHNFVYFMTFRLPGMETNQLCLCLVLDKM